MPTVDAHAHVFLRTLPMIAAARHRPDYDAPLTAFLEAIDAHGVERGVLVQPSFLGTDNGHLLRALGEARGRLAGVVVVAPEIADDALAAMAAAGVVGLRFNLIGRPLEDLAGPGPQALLRRVAALGWHAEVHVEGARLTQALRALDGFAGPIVIDHLGRPDPALGAACAGFRALLGAASDPRIHVKLSAPYRLGALDLRAATARLLDSLGLGRLVWGSDWPWTQHEAGRAYADLLPARFGLDAAAAAAVHATAARLFGFARVDQASL